MKGFEGKYNSNGMTYDITVHQLFGLSPVHITFVCIQSHQGNMGMGLSHRNNQTMVDEHFTVKQYCSSDCTFMTHQNKTSSGKQIVLAASYYSVQT